MFSYIFFLSNFCARSFIHSLVCSFFSLAVCYCHCCCLLFVYIFASILRFFCILFLHFTICFFFCLVHTVCAHIQTHTQNKWFENDFVFVSFTLPYIQSIPLSILCISMYVSRECFCAFQAVFYWRAAYSKHTDRTHTKHKYIPCSIHSTAEMAKRQEWE